MIKKTSQNKKLSIDITSSKYPMNIAILLEINFEF